jgi:aspartate/methionine/tyrosine aminotransferase
MSPLPPSPHEPQIEARNKDGALVTGHVARRAQIPPFYVMDVWLAAAERQRTHGDLVNLSAGQPKAGAPEPVRAAAAAALQRNQLGYTVALGIPELRAAIAASYRDRYRLEVDVDDVVVTTGSSGGFLLTFLACFDTGDRVAVSSPGYPCYRNILSALGCEVVEIECGPQNRFKPTAQMLAELDPPLAGVVVASPANPTGTVIPPAELAEIASWCDATGVRLISDEVYHGLVYEGAPQTSCAWQTSRNALVVNSFSKYYAMTGWRLGWLLVPTELRRAVDCLTGNFTICPPVLSQCAAVAAFTPEAISEADGHVHQYAKNRRLLLDGLRDIGVDRLAPTDGAFYVYADVSDFTSDSMAFCSTLLADTGVAIAPGIDFDTLRGSSFVRLSFAGPVDDIEQGLCRIGPWLQDRRRSSAEIRR